MRPIVPLVNPDSSKPDVTNLQDALLFLIDRGRIILPDDRRRELEAGLRRDRDGQVYGTGTGNVIIAVPKAITQESLRPYIVSGVGLMHARLSTQVGLLDTKSNLLGLDIGGGVIGFVSPRAGARFELRHFKNLSNDASGTVTIGGTKLSFWRLTAGLVLRY